MLTVADFQTLPPDVALAFIANLTDRQAAALNYDWTFWARPEQLAPAGDWTIWLALAGRGWGKTRCGAEWVRAKKDKVGRIALVAPTAADARDVMVEGQSGLLAISPPWDRPTYQSSNRRVTWANGAIATLYSADEPDRLRGPQHEAAWCDELAAWRYMQDAWDMLMFGLRLGQRPQACVTTTPRPVKLVRDLLKLPTTHVTRGSTYDNLANLAPTFRQSILDRYEGTRLGRQELMGDILEDIPGALWTYAMIEAARVDAEPQLDRVVVAIDPPATSGDTASECGIVCVGLAGDAARGIGYVLADWSEGGLSPEKWASKAVRLYRERRADRIVIETNQGGEMAEAVLRQVDRNLPIRRVHASRGKKTRAEPVSALYEKGRVKHAGRFERLEDQMTSYTGDGDSPDRMDALVWGLTDLMLPADAPFAAQAQLTGMV